MLTINKYSIPAQATFSVNLPTGAQIVKIGLDNKTPTVWILLETTNPTVQRNFRVIKTGGNIPETNVAYLGTIDLPSSTGSYQFKVAWDGDVELHILELL